MGLTFIIMCMCVPAICHLCPPRHGGGSRNVSGGMYPDVPAAGGGRGGFMALELQNPRLLIWRLMAKRELGRVGDG